MPSIPSRRTRASSSSRPEPSEKNSSRAAGCSARTRAKASTNTPAPCHSETVPAYTKHGPCSPASSPSGVKVSVSMPLPTMTRLSRAPVSSSSRCCTPGEMVSTRAARRHTVRSAHRTAPRTTDGTPSTLSVASDHTSAA